MKWTQDQLVKLRELAFNGKSNSEISLMLNVPIAEIYDKRYQLGITISKVQAVKIDGSSEQINAKISILKAKKNPLTQEQQLACAAYHLACFWYFARNKEVADWALPCEMCEHISICDLNYWENQRLLYQLSNVSLSDKMIKAAIVKKVDIQAKPQGNQPSKDCASYKPWTKDQNRIAPTLRYKGNLYVNAFGIRVDGKHYIFEGYMYYVQHRVHAISFDDQIFILFLDGLGHGEIVKAQEVLR